MSAFAGIKIIVPVPPGGTTDIAARYFSKFLTKSTKEFAVVENFGGGEGVIGTKQLLSSPPNTLMLSSSSWYINILEEKFQLEDFRVVSVIAEGPFFVMTTKNSDLTCSDLRSPDKKYFIGSGGGQTSMISKMLVARYPNITDVPYKGVKPAEVDLLGNRVDAIVGAGANTHLRLLANSSSKSVNNVPTIEECFKIRGSIVAQWILVASPGSSDEFVQRMNSLAKQFAVDPDTKQLLENNMMYVKASTVDHTATQVQQEFQNWKKLLK